MKNKIIFINSSFFEEEKRIPLGVLSLASILDARGLNVEILDFLSMYEKEILKRKESFYEDIEEIVEYILSKKPTILDFYTLCNSYHITLAISRRVREKNKDIKIIFGGPQATLTGMMSMEKYPWIDIIGIGEGENTILPLIESIIENKEPSNIKGILYRKGNDIIENGRADLIENLDYINELNYSLIDVNFFDAITIDVGRGCPYACHYCATKTFWRRKYRLKSPKRIIREIRYLKDTYGISNFGFIHDLFTVDKKKVLEICELIINEKLNITWRCSARADTLDKELILRMKEAGCNCIFLGIESGSPRMQKIMNKNLDVDYAMEMIKIIKKNDISPVVSFIYGFPEETIEDVQQTLKMIHKLSLLNLDVIQFHVLTVNPSTEIYNQLKDKLYFSEYVSEFSGIVGVNESKTDFIEGNKEIFCNFFEFDAPIRNQLKYLDRFMMYIFRRFTKYFRKTYLLLMDFYNEDIIEMFNDFNLINNNPLKDIRYKFNDQNIFDLIEKYILDKDFNDLDEKIKEIFRFELDVIQFTYFSKQLKDIKRYSIDVYKIKKGQELENIKINTTIEFNRIDENNINIKRIS